MNIILHLEVDYLNKGYCGGYFLFLNKLKHETAFLQDEF